MIKEIELSNENDFIKCFDHLYQDITTEYNFGYTMKKINIERQAKRINSLFSCCCSDRNFVYSNYEGLRNAIYDILRMNGIENRKTEDMSIEFILAKSRDEILVENGFAIHQDRDSGVDGDSYTLIIYLHTNCQGGELYFMKVHSVVSKKR